jgi:hypothetical protein
MMKLTGDLLTEQLTLEEYEEAIQSGTEAMDDMEKSLEPIESQMKSMGLDDMSMSIVSRPLKSFKEGIRTFHDGLAKLRFYVYEQNHSHLHGGLALLEKANNLFNYTADTTQYMMNDISKGLTEAQKKEVEDSIKK